MEAVRNFPHAEGTTSLEALTFLGRSRSEIYELLWEFYQECPVTQSDWVSVKIAPQRVKKVKTQSAS